MDGKVQIVTEKLQKMIQPYLGRREYGDLCIVGRDNKLPNWIDDYRITWFLNYESVFGSSSGICVNFFSKERIFEYLRYTDNAKTRTENPKKVLNYFRQRLKYIKPQRRKHLMEKAKLQKEMGIPLEKAVANIKKFAQNTQKFGPIEKELKLYEQFCYEIYSEK